jgi:multiple sugar transport system permease protein
MLPQHVTLIAQYAIFRDLGWIDTFLPLVVPKFLATDAFFVFLMVQFIRGLPRELYEAARIDGCGPFQIYLRIVLPLLRPALVTTAIFSFIWTYNDFFSQLIYLSSPENLTVPLALRSFLDASGQSEWGQMFAMSVVTLVPVVAMFVIFQRKIVAGMAHTGLK